MATAADRAAAAAATASEEESEITSEESTASPVEGDEETTPETAAPEGEPPPADELPEADSEPKPDDLSKQPPSLRAAVRLEKKARERQRDAEAKLAQVAERETALTQRIEEAQRQQQEFQRQVAPKAQTYDAMVKAAGEGRVADVLRYLKIDPDAALSAAVEEARNPLPPAFQRELAELRAFRERFESEAQERQRQQQAERQQEEARRQDTANVTQALAYGAFPELAAYRAQHGDDELMASAYAVQRQLPGADLPTLLRELNARAKAHMATQSPSANPPPSGGRQQAGNAAPPAAAGGARRVPSAVTGRAASERGGGGDAEFDLQKARAQAIAQLKADRFGAHE